MGGKQTRKPVLTDQSRDACWEKEMGRRRYIRKKKNISGKGKGTALAQLSFINIYKAFRDFSDGRHCRYDRNYYRPKKIQQRD